MSKKRIGMGLIGPGFIATHHIDAVRRLGNVDVVAIADYCQEAADKRAKDLNVDRAYGRFEDLVNDPDIDVIHNTTPNYLLSPVNRMVLEAGKHIICDKPLALNADEARQLRDIAMASRKAHVLIFNYRCHPAVQQARLMSAAGELGPIPLIHGHYMQDWLTEPETYSWRLDPSKGGASSALGDIGLHWCDLAQHVSGARIVSVLADLTTVVPVRYVTDPAQQAFSKGALEGSRQVRIESEDLACVLLRFDTGARGSLIVGQVLPGHKNDLTLELCGRKLSVRWQQEQPNELWLGRTAGPNCTLTKDPSQLLPEAQRYSRLPGGHQAGWSDAFFNVISDAYTWIRSDGDPEAKPAATATFEDGYRMGCVVEAMLRSYAKGGVWEDVDAGQECAAKPAAMQNVG